jgi:large subunit ribosomal protein L6
MSRIGRRPISVPKGVEIKIDDGNLVTVKGPKGQLQQQLPAEIIIAQENGTVNVQRPSEAKQHKSLHGLTRTLLFNMVHGVTEGWERRLEINGVGYRAALEGKTLVLQLGFSHPVRIEPPEHVSFAIGERRSASEPLPLFIRGINKQVVGEQAAKIRGLRPPEPYKGKGIKYAEERIRRKAGKAGKTK